MFFNFTTTLDYMAYSRDNIKTLLKDVILVKILDNFLPSSSIIIPDSIKGKPIDGVIRGRILEVGTKFRFRDEIGIGDVVLLPKQFGNKLTWDDESVRMFDGEDVLAVLC